MKGRSDCPVCVGTHHRAGPREQARQPPDHTRGACRGRGRGGVPPTWKPGPRTPEPSCSRRHRSSRRRLAVVATTRCATGSIALSRPSGGPTAYTIGMYSCTKNRSCTSVQLPCFQGELIQTDVPTATPNGCTTPGGEHADARSPAAVPDPGSTGQDGSPSRAHRRERHPGPLPRPSRSRAARPNPPHSPTAAPEPGSPRASRASTQWATSEPTSNRPSTQEHHPARRQRCEAGSSGLPEPGLPDGPGPWRPTPFGVGCTGRRPGWRISA